MSDQPPKIRKVRRDSVLKKLPEEQRALIAGWLDADGPQSCLQRMAAELGIHSNQSSLYEAITFWESESRFTRMHAMAKAQIEAESHGGLPPDKLEEAIDRRFIMLAEAKNDPELYMKLRYLRIADIGGKTAAKQNAEKIRQAEAKIAQKDRDLDLSTRRVALLEENAAKAKAALEGIKTRGGLTPETLREIEEAAKLL